MKQLWCLAILIALTLLTPIPAFAEERFSPILFSQIMVVGGTPNDEFIEIYNSSDQEIVLQGLSLIKETASGRQYTVYSFVDEIIMPENFLLLAHTQSSFIDQADVIYEKSLAANNKILLMDAENIIHDELAWGTASLDALANPVASESILNKWGGLGFLDEWIIDGLSEARNSLTIWPIQIDPPPPLVEPTPSDILLNEISLFPHLGDMQWIEIFNSGAEDVNLDEWILDDDDFTFTLSGTITPGEYKIFYWDTIQFLSPTILHLNNDLGETVDQWDIDIAVDVGQVYALTDGVIEVSDIGSAGRPNVLVVDEGICEVLDGDLEIDAGLEAELPLSSQERGLGGEFFLESGQITINEVFANPESDEGKNEFIEIYNNETSPINLDQWVIADKVKSFVLENLTIPPQSYIVLPRTLTSIALNNGSETVTLTDPFGEVISSYSYESTNEGQSDNYQPVNIWYQASPSPGLVNLPQQIEIPATNNVDATKDTPIIESVDTQNDPIQETNKVITEVLHDLNLHQIRLNELIPNPEGSDNQEWIELHNPSEESIKLSGLLISDPTWSYEFTSGEILPDDLYLLPREQSKIALNNSGDSIMLHIKDILIDEFSYQESQEGYSWGRDESMVWKQSKEPTPREKNTFPVEIKAAVSETPAKKTSSTKKNTTTQAKKESTSVLIDFANWETVGDKQNITVSGIISLSPKTFTARQAIIQDPGSTNSPPIELYFHKAEWPTLVEGQMVTISGEKSITSKGSRLLIRDVSAIKPGNTKQIELIHLNDVSADAIQNKSLVQAQATLIEQSKNSLLVDINGEEMIIDLKSASIVLDDLPDQASITLSGIINITKNPQVISLKHKTDLHYEAPKIESEKVVEENQILQPSIITNQSKNKSLIWLILGMGISGLLALIYLNKPILLSSFQKSKQKIINQYYICRKLIQKKLKTKS